MDLKVADLSVFYQPISKREALNKSVFLELFPKLWGVKSPKLFSENTHLVILMLDDTFDRYNHIICHERS